MIERSRVRVPAGAAGEFSSYGGGMGGVGGDGTDTEIRVNTES